MALVNDSISLSVSAAFDQASGTTTVSLTNFLVALISVFILLWLTGYTLKTFMTAKKEGSFKHMLFGFGLALTVVNLVFSIIKTAL